MELGSYEQSKYSFEKLKRYVEAVFKRYLNTIEAGTETERKKEQQRKEMLRQSALCCFAGANKDREFVKQFIFRVLDGQINVFTEGYGEDGVKITIDNYNYIFPWEEQYRLPTQIKFLALLYFLKPHYGEDTFDYLVNKYNLTRIRDIAVTNGNRIIDKGIYVDSKDIDAMFLNENVVFTYELALQVIVQLIYEEFKGNGCIDELLYQNIDDIGIGLSGLQENMEPIHLRNKKMKKAYDGAWVKYKGVLMHLTFLSFGSFDNLKRVVMQLVAYEQYGSFSEKDGYKMGYGKDGSRRTSVITPFAENCAAWIRKFTAKSMSNKQLITSDGVNNIANVENLIKVEKALVMGGATIPICGAQGSGKTTKLEALAEYIQNWYAIRMIESEFEARIRWRYPEKNILTVQTNNISPEKAYEFTLRTSGDIYIVSEVRSDEMMVNITRTASRGGRSVMFTYHTNKPRATIMELANSLVRKKLYNSLKDALYTTLEVVKCCIHIELDMEKRCRYYNIYEFIPVRDLLDKRFKEMRGLGRVEAFMDAQFSFYSKLVEDEQFEVVPIITYDRDSNAYVFKNNISDRLYDELYRDSSLDSEKEVLQKLFRPMDYICKYKRDNLAFSIDDLDKIIEKEDLTVDFIDREEVKKRLMNMEGSVCK